jgi:hypothetical protein
MENCIVLSGFLFHFDADEFLSYFSVFRNIEQLLEAIKKDKIMSGSVKDKIKYAIEQDSSISGLLRIENFLTIDFSVKRLEYGAFWLKQHENYTTKHNFYGGIDGLVENISNCYYYDNESNQKMRKRIYDWSKTQIQFFLQGDKLLIKNPQIGVQYIFSKDKKNSRAVLYKI